MRLFKAVAEPWRGDDGQTMAEYAVVLSVITIGILVVVGGLSGTIAGAFQETVDLVGPYLT